MSKKVYPVRINKISFITKIIIFPGIERNKAQRGKSAKARRKKGGRDGPSRLVSFAWVTLADIHDIR